MRDDNVFKAATGLHGGIGGRGDVCGSLLGASMMLSLLFGLNPEEAAKQKMPEPPGKKGPPAKKDDPTYLVGELYKWYKNEFGSVKCRLVRGKYEKEVDAEPGGKGLTKKERIDRVHIRCDKLTGRTAARAVEMIFDAMEERKRNK
jgi:C_GCAxxG_C_C family probable redox protein